MGQAFIDGKSEVGVEGNHSFHEIDGFTGSMGEQLGDILSFMMFGKFTDILESSLIRDEAKIFIGRCTEHFKDYIELVFIGNRELL